MAIHPCARRRSRGLGALTVSVPLQPSAPVSLTSHSLIAYSSQRILPLAAARDMFTRVLQHVDRSWVGRRGGEGDGKRLYGESRECLCGIVWTLYVRASLETHLLRLTLFTSWCTRHGGLRGPLASSRAPACDKTVCMYACVCCAQLTKAYMAKTSCD